jgi:hypothetical protein
MSQLNKFLRRARLRRAATILVGGFLVLLIISTIASTCDKGPPPPEATSTKVKTPEPTQTVRPTNTPPPPATNTPVPPAPTQPQVINRADCAAIRGTNYVSEEEHQWFLAHCIVVQQPPTPSNGQQLQPTQPPPPQPQGCGAAQNPWGYDFCSGGAYIYSPPANFCSYFSCIASFWDGVGYVMQCSDGMFSKSGGRQGSCSHHGGNSRPLYAY